MGGLCKNGLTHTGQPFPGWTPQRKGYRPEAFPVTEDLTSRCVSIPLGALFQHEDALYIAEAIRQAL